MRIVSKISADGNRWAVKFPKVDAQKCFPFLDGKQTAQPDECLAELQRLERNDLGVRGVDYREKFLNCAVCQWIRLLNNWKDENCIAMTAKDWEKSQSRLERKIVAERVAYARADWRCAWDERNRPYLICTITTNDNGAFQRNPFYRMWAWKMAEAAKSMSDDFESGGENGIDLRGECAQLLKELEEFKAEKRREDELKRVNEERFMCERHMAGGFCSPCKFDCPCYRNGMCVEAKA